MGGRHFASPNNFCSLLEVANEKGTLTYGDRKCSDKTAKIAVQLNVISSFIGKKKVVNTSVIVFVAIVVVVVVVFGFGQLRPPLAKKCFQFPRHLGRKNLSEKRRFLAKFIPTIKPSAITNN